MSTEKLSKAEDGNGSWLSRNIRLSKDWHVIHGYYCPNCGRALALHECKLERRFGGILRIDCPQCAVPVEHSGGMLCLLGLVVALLGGFIMVFETLTVGIAAGFFIIATMRLLRQFRRARVHAQTAVSDARRRSRNRGQ